jgi:AraC-like DNA-binding protein
VIVLNESHLHRLLRGYRTEIAAAMAERREISESRFTSLDRRIMREASNPSAHFGPQYFTVIRNPTEAGLSGAVRLRTEQVKWILKRLLAGARPDVSAVARELGLSDRTLQRRIDDDATTFRKLLLEASQELAREYLNRPDIDVAEVAGLLGYEDSNSFYRAFRTWEGTTPGQLRAELKHLLTTQPREVFAVSS